MQSVRLKIILESPVLLASNTGDPNMVGTHRYIPARSLRGLFAREYIKKSLNRDVRNAHRDERFYRWFLHGHLRFTDAFILTAEDGLTMPVPLSIQKEKRGKEIYDLLHEVPDIQTKPCGGYGRIENNRIYKSDVKVTLNFHHERDRETGTSKEGIIFNYESIDQGQPFGALIYGSREDLDEFTKIFSDGIYYLGRSRNNQYGKVYIKFNADFNELTQPEDLKPGKLSLTLLSDTIIYNEYGFPATDITSLERVIGCPIEKSFIKTSEIECFISRWRLKTPSEVSFSAGSTFLIDIPDEDALKRLLQLQVKGIGERTEEGFGRFILGIQKEDRLTVTEEQTIVSKPSSPPPATVKEIISETLKSHITAIVIREAIKKVEGVKNLPTPSLAGRLLLMLRDSKNMEDFKKHLKNLRKTARDKLEDCRVDSGSLLEFMNKFELSHIAPLNTLQTGKEFKELAEISQLNPLKDNSLINTLHLKYLQAFLSALMKKAKLIKEAGKK